MSPKGITFGLIGHIRGNIGFISGSNERATEHRHPAGIRNADISAETKIVLKLKFYRQDAGVPIL